MKSTSSKPGDKILLSFDYEPGSEAELGPMATSMVHQCCEKKLEISLHDPVACRPPLIEESFRKVIQADYPDMVYGQDYVNLGYKSGYEGVIKVIITDLPSLYTTDFRGTSIEQIPMCRGLKNLQSMNLLVSVSARVSGHERMDSIRRNALREQVENGFRMHRRAGAANVSVHSQPTPRSLGRHQRGR